MMKLVFVILEQSPAAEPAMSKHQISMLPPAAQRSYCSSLLSSIPRHDRACCVCGASGLIHAHHEDYTEPLRVAFLCAKHHAQRHAEINRAKKGLLSSPEKSNPRPDSKGEKQIQIRIDPANQEPLRAEAFKRRQSIPKTANEIIAKFFAEVIH